MTEDPARFGRWTVLDQLGQGGMGVVWRAVDPAGRLAAVKVARVRASAREALRREVEALERLRHPGLVRFLEHGATEDGALWVATELVEGRALRAHLHETHPSTASNAPSTVVLEDGTWQGELEGGRGERSSWTVEALRSELAVFRRLCDPLAWLHGEGHVHGDVKPENVVVRPDGGVVLVDLGLLRSFEGGARETLHTNARLVGTGAYLSPEQCLGRPPDGRSDLYAVGCMLFELLAGQPPFGQGWVAARHHLHTRPPRLSDRCDVPAALEGLVDALLRKDPRHRLGYATDLAEALEELGVAPTSGAPPVRRVLYRPALVGRAEALAAVAEGGPVVVTGETGSGCTRLLSHLVERPSTVTVAASGPGGLTAGWLTSLASRARGEDLAPWFGHAAATLAALQPALAEPLGVAPVAPSSRQEAVEAVLGALGAAGWPTVCADEADRGEGGERAELGDRLDLELISELVRRRASVVVSTRDPALLEKLERLGARRVTLGPLAPAEVATLLEDALATDALPTELLDHVNAHAGGNPRFVLQIAAQLVDEGALVRRRRRWGLVDRDRLASIALPEGLVGLGRRRMDAAPPEARAAAERAAILGLAAIHPDERGALEAARLVERRAEGWAWVVPGFRDVVAEGLDEARRRSLHDQALAALPPDAPHRERALHLLGAGRTGEARRALAAARQDAVKRSAWGEVVALAEQGLALEAEPSGSREDDEAEGLALRADLAAGYRARGRFAEAVALLEGRALDLHRPADRRAALHLGRAMARNGRAGEALALLESLARHEDDPVLRPGFVEALAETCAEIGDLPRSVQLRREVVAAREALGDPKRLAIARVALANVLQRQDHHAPAEELLALALPVIDHSGDPLWIGNAYATLAQLCSSRGTEEDLQRAAHRAIAAYREAGLLASETQLLGLLSDSYRRQRRPDEAERATDRMLAVAAETGNHRLLCQVTYLRALDRLDRGDEGALEALIASLGDLRATLNTSPEAIGSLRVAAELRKVGRPAEAEPFLRRVDELAGLREDEGLRLRAAIERAELALAGVGDGVTARARLEEAVARVGMGALEPREEIALQALRSRLAEVGQR